MSLKISQGNLGESFLRGQSSPLCGFPAGCLAETNAAFSEKSKTVL
jgi:hypothetical protein